MRRSLTQGLVVVLLLITNTVLGRILDLSPLSPDNQAHVKKSCPHLNGTDFSLADLDCLLHELHEMEQFESLQIIEPEPGVFRLRANKLKQVTQVNFSGNKTLGTDELISEFSLLPPFAFDQQELIDAGERVRKMYLRRAFLNTTVDLEFLPQSDNPQFDNQIKVRVNIKEGSQTRLANVYFVCDNLDLKTKLTKLMAKNLGQPLTDETISDIRNQAKQYFSDNHFLKSDLTLPRVEYSKD